MVNCCGFLVFFVIMVCLKDKIPLNEILVLELKLTDKTLIYCSAKPKGIAVFFFLLLSMTGEYLL